jgi:hypothetical protein
MKLNTKVLLAQYSVRSCLDHVRFMVCLERIHFRRACFNLPAATEEEVAKLICLYTGVRVNIGLKEYYEMQDFARPLWLLTR